MALQISEVVASRARWGLLGLWIIVLAELLLNPVAKVMLGPKGPLASLLPDQLHCVMVQGQCVAVHAEGLSASIFWGMVLPILVVVLFLFGHELWRRVCPLSFISILSREFRSVARDWFHRGDAEYSKKVIPPVTLKENSFLRRYHSYLQLAILYVALCCRILFVNSERSFLAEFMLFFILAAIIVGLLYDGKTWCQYLCPVAPVEEFFMGPRALLGNTAHLLARRRGQVSQSMCRKIDEQGKEKSICVACKQDCIDIDAEKAYWSGLMSPRKQFLSYGYAGLVVGYFWYYFLYAGNWHYYASGVWSVESHQAQRIFNPGLFLFGHGLFIPKIVSVPLVLGLFLLGGYGLGVVIERSLGKWQQSKTGSFNPVVLRHHCITLNTFAVFNFYFVFSGRNYIERLPAPIPLYVPAVLSAISAVWLYRTWGRRSIDCYNELSQKKEVAGIS